MFYADLSLLPITANADGYMSDPKYIIFSRNTANVRGSNLVGGLLDRCKSAAGLSFQHRHDCHNGVAYLSDINNIRERILFLHYQFEFVFATVITSQTATFSPLLLK